MIFEKKSIREILDDLVNLLVWLSLFLLILSFGLIFIQTKRIKRIEENITKVNEEQKEILKEYKIFEKKVEFLRALFPKIVFPSRMLEFVETRVLPDTSLSSLNCNIERGETTLQGKVPNLPVLQQQVDVFEEDKSLSSSLEKFSFGKEGIDFTIKFNFDKKIIR